MPTRLLSVVVLVTALGGVAFADARTDAKAQVEFGIAVAQRGLWKEAIYRWERATQIDPTYAAAFNNLAVAYEHEGMLDKAAEAYERALKLEPDNALVRQNFELFKESMTGRIILKLLSCTLAAALQVPSFYEIPIETPIAASSMSRRFNVCSSPGSSRRDE